MEIVGTETKRDRARGGGGASLNQPLEGPCKIVGCGRREVAAGGWAGMQGKISLAGQDGGSDIVGGAGDVWGRGKREGPDTFWTDGTPGEEVRVV